MESTTASGNEFRDLVSRLLNAAGFDAATEVRAGAKKADVRYVWTRHEFEGPIRYLVETKNYQGTLPLTECSLFVAEYGTAVRNGLAERALLISRGSISPDGRALIEMNRRENLFCFTFEEFQRNLLRVDAVLADLIRKYKAEGIADYYIPVKAKTGADLEELVRKWISAEDGAPIAIIGGYGTGKSTFAKHLGYQLANLAVADPTNRVPILVALGEIVDEQSIKGLISKTLASDYRATNYHFHLFAALNECGRFVIIFDGFDEMKHGMTPSIFERNFTQLLSLDVGRARILLLGRDTIFHDDIEFRMIIEGRRVTGGGTTIQIRDRRACEPIMLEGFDLLSARKFVSEYYPFKVKQERAFNSRDEDRVAFLLSGPFDELLLRPVHAQMLCDIASQLEIELTKLDKFELYDRFVFYLLDRETKKKGRSGVFTLDSRRAISALIAWWLWENGGASTTSLETIPIELFMAATQGIAHEFDEAGLRRELSIGCLVEKAAGTIYFPHRSIQEFLGSEYLYENVFELENNAMNVLKLMDVEIVEFFVGRLKRDKERTNKARQVLGVLGRHIPTLLSPATMMLLKALGVYANQQGSAIGAHWEFWAFLLSASGRTEEIKYAPEVWRRAVTLCEGADHRKTSVRSQLTGVFGLIWAFLLRSDNSELSIAEFLSHLGDYKMIAGKMCEAARGSKIEIERRDSVRAWIIVSCLEIESNGRKESFVKFDVEGFFKRVQGVLMVPFEQMVTTGLEAFGDGVVSCPAEMLMEKLADLSADEQVALRRFFSSEVERKRFMPDSTKSTDEDSPRDNNPLVWQGLWLGRRPQW